jgi:outer membrane receptor protein involved in Fe transport
MFSETTFEVNRFSIQVRPQGPAAMEPLPEQTLGNFFNRQDRSATSYQLIHALSGTSHGRFGLHMYKAGFDVVVSRFDAISESRPILIRRSNGSLARQLVYGPRTSPSIDSTDLAFFVQDRVQPGNRWYVELGARLDRDGVIDRFNLTPRIGSAILLNASATAVLRGGFGLFFERTPSTVGVFRDLEMTTETRYASDGITPLGPAMPFPHTIAGDLRTPRSRTWDVSYDHRFNPRWAVHAGAIDRRGSREYILEPVVGDSGAALQLRSAGRSKYREVELGLQFTGASGLDLKASYVRSVARTDLNAFTLFYDSVVTPVLGENEYAPARADVPHRFLARWRAMPTPNWLWIGVLDWRSGLPFSPVNEMLDFVGPRNRARFPTYFRLDLGVEHRVKLFKLRPWVGVRVENALNSWLPADVQANISSPAFRTFYNSEYRQYRIQFRFER